MSDETRGCTTAQIIPWGKFSPTRLSVNLRGLGTSHLDIGCGTGPKNPFCSDQVTGLDVISPEVISGVLGSPADFVYVQANLLEGLPFEDSSFASLSAYDVLEHIPRILSRPSGVIENPFISLMNEIHRVLEPGGAFLGFTPSYPSGAAFQDPTHVNFISARTVEYFTHSPASSKPSRYGFNGCFELVHQSWARSGHLHKHVVQSTHSDNVALATSTTMGRARIIGRKFSRIRGRLSLITNPTHLVWLLRACDK